MASDQSVFGNLEIALDDSIFGLQKSYVEDTHPQKVNLGVGGMYFIRPKGQAKRGTGARVWVIQRAGKEKEI